MVFDFGKKKSGLLSLDEATSRAAKRTEERPACQCFDSAYSTAKKWRYELKIHSEKQDKTCSAWLQMLDLIEQAADDEREVFEPGADMLWEDWIKIVILPPTISTLKKVKELRLYGSNLASIPTEIGEMESLKNLDIYTSYRLHWLPYEIMDCKNLQESRISTRALYGNQKLRAPFPKIKDIPAALTPTQCSVCKGTFIGWGANQFWISLNIATDVVPLLVSVCSPKCKDSLPVPAQGYIDKPHKGGLGQVQPPSGFLRR